MDRGIVIPLVLFVLLGFGTVVVKKPFHKPAEIGGGKAKAFPGYKGTKTDRVLLTKGKEKLELVKDEDGGWSLASHSMWPAQAELVSEALGAIRDLELEKNVLSDKKDSYEGFKVRDEDLLCEIHDGEVLVAKMIIGEHDSSLDGTYLRLGDNDSMNHNVRMGKGDLTQHFKLDVTHYMDPKIPDADNTQEWVSGKVTIAIKHGKEDPIIIEGTVPAEGDKDKKAEWNIVEPVKFPADPEVMGDFTRFFKTFEADDVPIEGDKLYQSIMTTAEEATKIQIQNESREGCTLVLGTKEVMYKPSENLYTVAYVNPIPILPGKAFYVEQNVFENSVKLILDILVVVFG